MGANYKRLIKPQEHMRNRSSQISRANYKRLIKPQERCIMTELGRKRANYKRLIKPQELRLDHVISGYVQIIKD